MTGEYTPHVGMVNVSADNDGIHRLYPIYQQVYQDTSFYYSLAVSAALRYKGIVNDESPEINIQNKTINISDVLNIHCYGKQQYFLLNLQCI